MSSTAAATLRQLVMFVVDKVVEEDRRMLPARARIDRPSGRNHAIARPRSARCARHLRGPMPAGKRRASAVPAARTSPQDVCARTNREHTDELSRYFPQGACLFQLTPCWAVLTSLSCSQHPELLLLLQHHLSPLLLKTLSERSSFPLTLRGTRVVFLLNSSPPNSRRKLKPFHSADQTCQW